MFSLELNTKVFWELSGGGDLEKVKRENERENERKGRETSHTQLSHFFSHRTDSFPPEGKLTFLIKNNFSVKREKVALHIKREKLE